jgi:hypothetical protein
MQADQLAIRLKEGSCIDNDGVGHPPTDPLVINARLFRIGILSPFVCSESILTSRSRLYICL